LTALLVPAEVPLAAFESEAPVAVDAVAPVDPAAVLVEVVVAAVLATVELDDVPVAAAELPVAGAPGTRPSCPSALNMLSMNPSMPPRSPPSSPPSWRCCCTRAPSSSLSLARVAPA
jgi:hypothetical protein